MYKFSEVLLLSGGEPLVYENVREIISIAREIGFSFISLNTNGLLLTDEIAQSVDAIIVSLDSLDRKKSDSMWNRAGATDRVLAVLEKLSRKSHPSLMVNSVILPENIEDVGDILAFCSSRNITFSAGPALKRTQPVKGLKGNPQYRKLIEKILQAKKSGQKIAATIDYLKGIVNFTPFVCLPQLVWRVYPNGDLVFPCSRKNCSAGNLRENPDPIYHFRKTAGGWFFEEKCEESCPLSCYMDTSLMIQKPLSLLREGIFRLRTFSRGHRLVY